MSTAMTGVKMGSNGQALLKLVVKRSSSLAEPHQINGQEHEMVLGRPAVAIVQCAGVCLMSGSKVKSTINGSDQAVKEHF